VRRYLFKDLAYFLKRKNCGAYQQLLLLLAFKAKALVIKRDRAKITRSPDFFYRERTISDSGTAAPMKN